MIKPLVLQENNCKLPSFTKIASLAWSTVNVFFFCWFPSVFFPVRILKDRDFDKDNDDWYVIWQPYDFRVPL